ncbi:MAG: hypothetical protein ACREVL_08565, partial [Solimonas sp.]
GYGLIGQAGAAVGSKPVQEFGERGYSRNIAEAGENAPAVADIGDIGSGRDAALYAAGGLGQLVPFAGVSIATGAGGRRIGRSVGGALGAAEKGAEYGTLGGLAANSIGTESGLIYGDIKEKTGESAPGTALRYGAAAGALDVIPEMGLVKKFTGAAARESIGKAVAKQMLMEGGTEGAQSYVENRAVQAVDPNQDALSSDGVRDIVNSTAIGALGGGVFGLGGEVASRAHQRGARSPVVDPIAEAAGAETQRRQDIGDIAALAAADPNAGPLTRAIGNNAAASVAAAPVRVDQTDAQPGRAKPLDSEFKNLQRRDEEETATRLKIDEHRQALEDSIFLPQTSGLAVGESLPDQLTPDETLALESFRERSQVPSTAGIDVRAPRAEAVELADEAPASADGIQVGEASAADAGSMPQVHQPLALPAPSREMVVGTDGVARRATDEEAEQAAQRRAEADAISGRAKGIKAPPAELRNPKTGQPWNNILAANSALRALPEREQFEVKRLDKGQFVLSRKQEAPRAQAATQVPAPRSGATSDQPQRGLGAALAVTATATPASGNTAAPDAGARTAAVAGGVQPQPVPALTPAPAPAATTAAGAANPNGQTQGAAGAAPVARNVQNEAPAAEAAATAVAPKPKRGWSAFTRESGSLGVPRAQMPQIAAEHRGAMVNFLAARGIAHQQVDVDPATLKPTQAEFSPGRVRKAKDFKGGDRSILVSSDGYVLDGHHQWLAKLEAKQPIKAIRLDAPIKDLLPAVKEFPSAASDTSSAPAGAPASATEQPVAKAATEGGAAATGADQAGTTIAADAAPTEATGTAAKPGAKATTKGADRIEDFGQKLGGARKDLWSGRRLEVADLQKLDDIDLGKLVKKDQVFPTPDHEARAAKYREQAKRILDLHKAGKNLNDSESRIATNLTRAQNIDPVAVGNGLALWAKKVRDSIAQPDGRWPRATYESYVAGAGKVRDYLDQMELLDFGRTQREHLKAIFGDEILRAEPNGRSSVNRESDAYKLLAPLGNRFLDSLY